MHWDDRGNSILHPHTHQEHTVSQLSTLDRSRFTSMFGSIQIVISNSRAISNLMMMMIEIFVLIMAHYRREPSASLFHSCRCNCNGSSDNNHNNIIHIINIKYPYLVWYSMLVHLEQHRSVLVVIFMYVLPALVALVIIFIHSFISCSGIQIGAYYHYCFIGLINYRQAYAISKTLIGLRTLKPWPGLASSIHLCVCVCVLILFIT